MGKRIIPQRRGRGSIYRSPSHRHAGGARNIPKDEAVGVVKELKHDPGRTAPLAVVEFQGYGNENMIAGEGMFVGQEVKVGRNAPLKVGNILPVAAIPEGTRVYNVELKPGDGGKLARAAGSFAVVYSHDKKTVVKLPSERFITVSPDCRAVVGTVAGSGQGERPFAKSGKVYHSVRSKSKRYFKVKGIAMNAVDHPHGGGGHPHVGTSSTVSSNAPPGR